MKKLLNTRQHDLHVHADGVEVIVPAATTDTSGDNAKLVKGSAEVEDSFVKELSETQMGKVYFSEGYLEVADAEETEVPKKADAKKK